MSIFYSADLNRDIDRYLEDQDAQIRDLPRCCECEEPIQDDCLYEFGGNLYCADCVDLNHRRYTDEFIA